MKSRQTRLRRDNYLHASTTRSDLPASFSFSFPFRTSSFCFVVSFGLEFACLVCFVQVVSRTCRPTKNLPLAFSGHSALDRGLRGSINSTIRGKDRHMPEDLGRADRQRRDKQTGKHAHGKDRLAGYCTPYGVHRTTDRILLRTTTLVGMWASTGKTERASCSVGGQVAYKACCEPAEVYQPSP